MGFILTFRSRVNRDESTFMKKKKKKSRLDALVILFLLSERAVLQFAFNRPLFLFDLLSSSRGGDLPCSTLDLLRRVS